MALSRFTEMINIGYMSNGLVGAIYIQFRRQFLKKIMANYPNLSSIYKGRQKNPSLS